MQTVCLPFNLHVTTHGIYIFSNTFHMVKQERVLGFVGKEWVMYVFAVICPSEMEKHRRADCMFTIQFTCHNSWNIYFLQYFSYGQASKGIRFCWKGMGNVCLCSNLSK